LVRLPNSNQSDGGFIDVADLVNRATPAPLADTEEETLAFLAYTSGSTGKPKGVMHCHKNIRAVIEAYGKNIVDPQPEDRYFASSRLFFTYGLGASLLYPLSAGATTILSATPPRPDLMADIFARYRPTVFFGVPSVYRTLLEHFQKGNPLDLASLKFGVSAGEALPAKLSNEWFDLFGVDILDGIGSTEMLHTFIANRFGERHPGSSGRVVPGYKAKLISESGDEIIGAGAGNLFVTGNSQTSGYWCDPEKTSETIINGWMRTGDVYRRDENDIYWFEGRSDDMFKSRGTWISPIEVEEILLRHPAVREAAVVCGHDDDGLGIVVAYVACNDEVPKPEMSEELRNHTLQFLPRYKCPSIIRFIDELPRTATGKAQRFRLRILEQQKETTSN
jgi:benzoate-CoA ligase